MEIRMTINGVISFTAAVQFLSGCHTSIIAIIFWMKISGMAAAIAENRIQNTVTGTSTG